MSTPFAGGLVGAAGNMFDMVAAKDLYVTNFAVHARSASLATVEVWMKNTVGVFKGSQTTSASWTKIGQATFTTAAAGKPSILPVDTVAPVLVKAGTIQAFYVTFTSGTNLNRYTSGKTLTTVLASNSDLTIRHGYAKHYLFGADVTSKAWNGIVYYKTATTTV